MALCNVHYVRYYNLPPIAIHCVAYETESNKLALARSDNRIEIWDFTEVPHMECVIPNLRNNSVESVAWCDERLFSTGLEGFVVEYNLSTLAIKYQHSVTAGPAWCLAVNKSKTLLAVGTEDGYLNLFSIIEDEIMYNKIMDKQEGRILCIAWEHSGRMLVTGSSDVIRIWDVETGHAIHKMTMSRSARNVETVVWCIAVTKEFTIVSGDSCGELCIWDGHQGVMQQNIKTHSADILSLCLSKDERTISCSGVDPVISQVTYVQIKSTPSSSWRWVRSCQRKVHDHDVCALAMSGSLLISGGIGGYLAVSSTPPISTRYPPLLESPAVMVCRGARLLLLRYWSRLEVWHLGALTKEPQTKKLLVMESAGKDPMTCAALSQDGRWLAYSTPISTHFFNFHYTRDMQEPLLNKMKDIPEEVGPCQHIRFTPDSNCAVLATNSLKIIVLRLVRDGGDSTIRYTRKLIKEKRLEDRVFLMDISSNGQFLVAADHKSNIVVWTLAMGKFYCSLPRYKCPPTALAIHPETNNLVVAYSDHNVLEYSLSEKQYTKFSGNLNATSRKQWLSRAYPVRGITFDLENPQVMILYDDVTMHVINKDKVMPNSGAKIPRLDSSHSDSMDSFPSNPRVSEPETALHVIKKYKHLVHLDWLYGNEIVAVEVSPASLVEQLPPVLSKKHFGR